MAPSTLPDGYQVRPATWGDLEAVHALVRAVDLASVGAADTTLADLRSAWERPRFDVSRDVLLVLAETGQVVGYLAVHEETPGLELEAEVYGHPDLTGSIPVERYLVEDAVARAQRAADVSGSRWELVAYAIAGEPLGDELEACGFEIRRRFWRMGIELDQPIDVRIPDGVAITPLDPERDLAEVHEVITAAFSRHWGNHPETLEEFRHHHLGHPDADASLWRVARRDGRVVGGVIGRPDTELGSGWISMVGVDESERGRGVAGALLRSTFEGMRRHGLSRAMLGVDSQNETGATVLYERAGMNVLLEILAWVRDTDPSGQMTA